MNIKKFIENVLIDEIGRMINCFPYQTFGCIASGIDSIHEISEYLKSKNYKKYRGKDKYKNEFLFGYEYFSEEFKNLYTKDIIWNSLRCSMLHGWIIKGVKLTHLDCDIHTKNLLELNYFYNEYVKALKKFMNELTQSELNTEIISIK